MKPPGEVVTPNSGPIAGTFRGTLKIVDCTANRNKFRSCHRRCHDWLATYVARNITAVCTPELGKTRVSQDFDPVSRFVEPATRVCPISAQAHRSHLRFSFETPHKRAPQISSLAKTAYTLAKKAECAPAAEFTPVRVSKLAASIFQHTFLFLFTEHGICYL